MYGSVRASISPRIILKHNASRAGGTLEVNSRKSRVNIGKEFGIVKVMKKTKQKIKKGAWFYKVRGSYMPCSWQGWTIEVGIVVLFFFATKALLFEDEPFHASSLFTLFTYLIALGVASTWVANQKS